MSKDKTTQALTGLRVLDAGTFLAAPFCAAIMGEFGAEVIKIEQPESGDPFRKFGTPTSLKDATLAWLSEARNKKSLSLNLRHAEGAEIFKGLIKTADVLCENFRPGTLEKWGLGWDVLKDINPQLIMLRVSGYGQTGPYKDRPGFARIAHAVGGLSYLAGMPDGPPVTPGSTSLADYMTGLYGLIGVLIALQHRQASGEGQIVDIALYESVFRVLDEIALAYAHAGKVRQPEGTGTHIACPHGHFRCADNKWVAIACTSDKMFSRLAEAMGAPELAAKENYGEQSKRLAAREVVDSQVIEWAGSLCRDDVVRLCVEHEVPCGSINTIADIFEDEQFQARQNLMNVAHKQLGDITIPGVLPRLSESPGKVSSLGPSLGEHTSVVLKQLLGFSDEEIERLREMGVL